MKLITIALFLLLAGIFMVNKGVKANASDSNRTKEMLFWGVMALLSGILGLIYLLATI